jgi:hypothetical protein
MIKRKVTPKARLHDKEAGLNEIKKHTKIGLLCAVSKLTNYTF